MTDISDAERARQTSGAAAAPVAGRDQQQPVGSGGAAQDVGRHLGGTETVAHSLSADVSLRRARRSGK